MEGLYFNYLRSGLDFYLKQIKGKRRVLLPAFICPVVPEVFRRNGFEIEFADADLGTFNMDLGRASDFPLVLVCHTFGARCEVPDNAIEDCAHFLSKEREGKAAFYSMSKQLPNIRGGYIETDEELDNSHLLCDRYSFFEILIKLAGPQRALINFLRSKKGLPECELDTDWDVRKASWLVFGHDPSENLRIWEQLKGHFEKLGLREFFAMQEMPEGSVPFNFSVRLKEDSSRRRDEILLALRRKGVFGDRLWYNADTSDLPNATLLSRTVINLPLHPQSCVKLGTVL